MNKKERLFQRSRLSHEDIRHSYRSATKSNKINQMSESSTFIDLKSQYPLIQDIITRRPISSQMIKTQKSWEEKSLRKGANKHVIGLV
jgi:hypothetical protein